MSRTETPACAVPGISVEPLFIASMCVPTGLSAGRLVTGRARDPVSRKAWEPAASHCDHKGMMPIMASMVDGNLEFDMATLA